MNAGDGYGTRRALEEHDGACTLVASMAPAAMLASVERSSSLIRANEWMAG